MNERRNFLKTIVAAVGAWLVPQSAARSVPVGNVRFVGHRYRVPLDVQQKFAWLAGNLDAMGGLSK